ncbi:hypothetical protein GH714_031586 [Hevea brasiliensis]|uniref:anthocyanidin 3-O-glucosyltransferase n=1 Tax=Hevea brasiliensis TaxID=3981 RepID=A0A6A6LI98_HEVBR|nr:hypothetical protein GH714_031586 [Hevea brasiliensis]
MVGWAPQQKVLSHPSIACFLSHCGWNSTMEGVANGAPFLCRPYFADQFLNESYITEVWKVGLKFNRSESGIITREEIKNKEEQVLSGENIVARASEFKERAMKSAGEGGLAGKVEDLINRINTSEDEKITCVIADRSMGWAIGLAEKMKIPRAAFWPAAAAQLSMISSIQNLIDDGIIDNDGTPLKNQMFQLTPAMPAVNTANLIWACVGDFTTQKIVFDYMVETNEIVKAADWIVCNSVYDLEPGAFTFAPNVLPIGPLLASNRLGDTVGHFWPEDSSCLKWLDQQPPKSVIYVAFGSFTVFDKTQFQELALGLEISCRPFLWVVRPDIVNETNAYPDGFQERIGTRGRLVGWTSQQKVLSHPSIACFLSHCGWNSTLESVCNGSLSCAGHTLPINSLTKATFVMFGKWD